MAEIVATTSLPVDRLTATDCNAAARANKVQLRGPAGSSEGPTEQRVPPALLEGALKWPTGSGKGSNPRLLGAPVNFC